MSQDAYLLHAKSAAVYVLVSKRPSRRAAMSKNTSKADRKRQNQAPAPDRYTAEQMIVAAHYFLAFQSYNWFAIESDGQPFLPRLLAGLYLSYRRGRLASKNQAKEFMNAVDGRTFQRYLQIAIEHKLVEVHQSIIDKRVDLLCPTDKLIDVVEAGLTRIADSARSIEQMLSRSQLPNITSKNMHDIEFSLWPERDLLKEKTKERLTDSNMLTEEAAWLSETIRLAPKNVDALLKRSLMYLFGNEYEKALSDAKQAIRLDKDNSTAHDLARVAIQNDPRNAASLATARAPRVKGRARKSRRSNDGS